MEAQKKLKAEQEAAAAAAASHNPSTHVITPDYAAGLIAPAMAVRIQFPCFLWKIDHWGARWLSW